MVNMGKSPPWAARSAMLTAKLSQTSNQSSLPCVASICSWHEVQLEPYESRCTPANVTGLANAFKAFSSNTCPHVVALTWRFNIPPHITIVGSEVYQRSWQLPLVYAVVHSQVQTTNFHLEMATWPTIGLTQVAHTMPAMGQARAPV
jgi:hypothetical protein